MLMQLDASAVRRWCTAAADELHAHRSEIDDLNVFPIPDGDTGTNLALTLRSASEAVASDRSAAAGTVLRAMAQGALLGARGNSGVIVSQVLRGFADAFDGAFEGDGQLVTAGLRSATDAAYAAVSEPVEGTILSVMRGAADAADSAGGTGLADIVRAACSGARQALDRTPQQLEVLARAGVVDAGGRGLVVLLDALAMVVTGDQRADPRVLPGRDRAGLESVRETGSAEFGYEVQYLLHAGQEAIQTLCRALSELGDSLAVVGSGDGLFNVHVHVNDVGAAIEAGIEAGRPHRITVVRFADQLAAEGELSRRSGTAVVAVAPGDGLVDLFRSEGVLVVEGGPTQNPSTVDVLDELRDSGAAQIILLPNASAVSGVAELAAEQARECGLVVAVVPTKSPVQGLAAVAVHDESRRFEDDVIAMAEAAAATRFAEVTVAVRESITFAGRCAAGDVLGLIDGEVVEIGADVAEVAIRLVERLIGAGGELVTVLAGADPGAEQASRTLERHIRQHHPVVEVSAFAGGQPHFPLLIGVE
ncbi:MAG: fatty acid kinase [Pseudonocardiales bacterium]|jgi:DAK2 domain fusion protein YloV|nr:fatty acid kinase [Pseudonocardiales bacterium]